MTHATTATSTSTATAMGNVNKKNVSNSLSVGDLHKHSAKITDNKDVAKWSSTEVHNWIKEQCKRFDLKKATIEKFQMNGQALVLLTKHDFLRRSPDGGEILYYALQRLINPGKANLSRVDQTSLRNGSATAQPRIVEIGVDSDEFNDATDSASPKPIIEEPDDPPKIRKSHSEAHYHPQQQAHPFFFNQSRVSPAVVTMPAGAAAAYFQQQRQGFPNGFLHPNQQNVFHPNLFQHFHPMMTARGILIEAMEDIDLSNFTADGVSGSTNGANLGALETLYLVTMNGQQYVMNEEQVTQLVSEVYQQQTYQENLQQQQLFHQQQQFYQQQQQQYFQRQQQQQQHYQQQQQQQQQQQHPYPEQQRQ